MVFDDVVCAIMKIIMSTYGAFHIHRKFLIFGAFMLAAALLFFNAAHAQFTIKSLTSPIVSAPLTTTSTQAPVVSSLSPNSGPVGTQFTIRGTGKSGGIVVKFGGSTYTGILWNGSSAVFYVPSSVTQCSGGACREVKVTNTTYPVSLAYNTEGPYSNAVNFAVTLPSAPIPTTAPKTVAPVTQPTIVAEIPTDLSAQGSIPPEETPVPATEGGDQSLEAVPPDVTGSAGGVEAGNEPMQPKSGGTAPSTGLFASSANRLGLLPKQQYPAAQAIYQYQNFQLLASLAVKSADGTAEALPLDFTQLPGTPRLRITAEDGALQFSLSGGAVYDVRGAILGPDNNVLDEFSGTDFSVTLNQYADADPRAFVVSITYHPESTPTFFEGTGGGLALPPVETPAEQPPTETALPPEELVAAPEMQVTEPSLEVTTPPEEVPPAGLTPPTEEVKPIEEVIPTEITTPSEFSFGEPSVFGEIGQNLAEENLFAQFSQDFLISPEVAVNGSDLGGLALQTEEAQPAPEELLSATEAVPATGESAGGEVVPTEAAAGPDVFVADASAPVAIDYVRTDENVTVTVPIQNIVDVDETPLVASLTFVSLANGAKQLEFSEPVGASQVVTFTIPTSVLNTLGARMRVLLKVTSTINNLPVISTDVMGIANNT